MFRKYFLSFLIAIAIAYLSLSSSENFNKFQVPIPHFDKIVHAGMYFTLMMSIIVEMREKLIVLSRLLLSALVPFSYGIIMELLQFILTQTRSGSPYDALFNTFGILLAFLFVFLFRPLGIRLK
ncbi:MAG TPA: VanZ family protein [Bacteroidales bacterium]|nr:VanZ family protein [Bacteroidales bacterium]